jgi:hypothetical protein
MTQGEFDFGDDGKPQSLIHHEQWPLLRRYIRVQHVRNDTEHGRARIEVLPGFPMHLCDIQMRCVYCGEWINPLRRRKGESKRGKNIGAWFIAVTCDLKTRISCSRSGEARNEYIRIVDDKRKWDAQ